MGLLPVLQPQLVHFHDYHSPTADFMRSAACAAQRMYARAGVGAPDPPQNSSFRVSAGALGTVGPGWNDIGARLGRLVAALAHRLACTLESERRRDERHCGRGRPRKARLVVQRAGAPHAGACFAAASNDTSSSSNRVEKTMATVFAARAMFMVVVSSEQSWRLSLLRPRQPPEH